MAPSCILSLRPEAAKSGVDLVNGDDPVLLNKIWSLYEGIIELPSLKPSPEANSLFSQLVSACVPHSPVDVSTLDDNSQDMRRRLIKLCGEAEGLLESHYSNLLGSFEKPLDHIEMFPYYGNYVKLAKLEHEILKKNSIKSPVRVAFIGSGPLPLTSIVLAQRHLRSATFHNYDIDGKANALARKLVAPDDDLRDRMIFHTADIMEITEELAKYDVVFLAALVGMTADAKNSVLNHLAKYMAPGATLMLRSAHGARAFLYPIVDLTNLRCFELLSVFHPTDDVINSVVISRKLPGCSYAVDLGRGPVMFPCKCSLEVAGFNSINSGYMLEEMTTIEEPAS